MKKRYLFVSMVILIITSLLSLGVTASLLLDKAIVYRDNPISDKIMIIVYLLVVASIVLIISLIAALGCMCDDASSLKEKQKNDDMPAIVMRSGYEYMFREHPMSYIARHRP